MNLSCQKYQKAHLHDGINKYARLEKPPVNTLGDMAVTRKNVNRQGGENLSPKTQKYQLFYEKLNLSCQKYQKAHLHDGIIKYARLEKPSVNTLGDMAVTRKLLTDRVAKMFNQKNNFLFLKLYKMSRKVISSARPDRQTDDIMMTIPFGKLPRGKKV